MNIGTLCIGIGCGILIALMGFGISMYLAEKKTQKDMRMRSIAREEIGKAKGPTYWHEIIGLSNNVARMVDARMEQKEQEGEHEE